MILNAEGRARLQSHLQNVLRQPCSVCGGNSFQLEDSIFELREFVGGGVAADGIVKPVLTITCQSCGHINFMSPLSTGIISYNPPQMQAQPEPTVITTEESTEED